MSDSVTVELMFGSKIKTVIREFPALPRIGEMVTVYGEDDLTAGQSHFRVKDVWWTSAGAALQHRVLVAVMLQ